MLQVPTGNSHDKPMAGQGRPRFARVEQVLSRKQHKLEGICGAKRGGKPIVSAGPQVIKHIYQFKLVGA